MKEDTFDRIFEVIESFRKDALRLRDRCDELIEENISLKQQIEYLENDLSDDEINLINLYRSGKIDKSGMKIKIVDDFPENPDADITYLVKHPYGERVIDREEES